MRRAGRERDREMHSSQRVLAVSNQKGGTGKTTTVVNLAAALGEAGEQVLIVDMDPQASASHWLRSESAERGLLDVLLGERAIDDLVQTNEATGVSIVGASNWLMAAERLLNPADDADLRLRRALEPLDGRYGYILIDCPPTLGVLALNALVAANEVLIPVETSVLPLHGLRQLLETIEVVRTRRNPELRIAGIVPSRVDRRTRIARDILDDLSQRFPELTLDTCIRQNVRLAECPSRGLTILQYDATSHGAEDFRALAAMLRAQKERTEAMTPGRP